MAHSEAERDVGSGGGPGELALPGWYRCAVCGYASGESGSVVCPECGFRAKRFDVDVAETRRERVEAWRRGGADRAVGRWAAVIAVYTLGASVVGRSVWALVLTPLALIVAVGLSWHLGRVVAACKREDLRASALVTWQRGLWRLHLPWLVSPLFVGAALLVGFVDVWAGGDVGGMYWGVVVMGLGLWLIGCLISFVVWWTRYLGMGGGLEPGPGHLGLSDAAAFVLGVLVCAGACAIGFGAGVLSAEGVAAWLSLETVGEMMLDEF